MKTVLAVVVSLFVFSGAAPSGLSAEIEKPKQNLTTIKYSGTFEIVGAEKKDLTLDELVVALRRLATEHPESEYEVLAEFKAAPEESDKVIKAIRDSGVRLKHYWAPASDTYPESKPGPYGAGHVDIAGLP